MPRDLRADYVPMTRVGVAPATRHFTMTGLSVVCARLTL
jgi:hypothetical protein